MQLVPIFLSHHYLYDHHCTVITSNCKPTRRMCSSCAFAGAFNLKLQTRSTEYHGRASAGDLLTLCWCACFSCLEYQLDASANERQKGALSHGGRQTESINAVSAKNHISLVDSSLDNVCLCVCVLLPCQLLSTENNCPFNTCHGKATKILPFSIAEQQHLFP